MILRRARLVQIQKVIEQLAVLGQLLIVLVLRPLAYNILYDSQILDLENEN